MRRHGLPLLLLAALLVTSGGCTGRVVRTISVDSQPQGAIVWLNDHEVGRTPMTIPFTWYGVYRVQLEKDGYRPLTVYERVAAPYYQWIPLDLAFETVIPGERYDEHTLGPYTLEPVVAADPQQVLERAAEFRQEASGDLGK